MPNQRASCSISIDPLPPPFPLALRVLLRCICLAPFGSTACIVCGQKELGMFSTHVGDTCLMPFYMYEGRSGRLIATALHPDKTTTTKAIIGILRRGGGCARCGCGWLVSGASAVGGVVALRTAPSAR